MEKMPVFVQVEDYRDVLALLRAIEKKVDDAKDTLLRINELKNEEDELVEHRQTGLAEVEKKIEFINHSLNEPEHF